MGHGSQNQEMYMSMLAHICFWPSWTYSQALLDLEKWP